MIIFCHYCKSMFLYFYLASETHPATIFRTPSEKSDRYNVSREEEIVDCLILKGNSSEEWRKEQLEDQIFSFFSAGKRA